MLKKLLAGLMAALTAGTGSGAATQADQFAEKRENLTYERRCHGYSCHSAHYIIFLYSINL